MLGKEIKRGSATEQVAAGVLGRIATDTDFAALQGCALVIEAVFEKPDIKADVTRRAETVIPQDAVFASNTSTLPITDLARASNRQDRFIGLHFFSPVDRMPLVEVIVGRNTSDVTVARALDFVGQLRKTPIVVNDKRHFYASRVFGTYLYEGLDMLGQGVRAAFIENAARIAGMPVGPLAVLDEVTVALQDQVIIQAEQELGASFVRPPGYDVIKKFVYDLNRRGRRFGGGFYEYPAQGAKFLWPGLAKVYPQAAKQPSLQEAIDRFLYIQAIESVRCLEEGVLRTPADGDLGSVYGWNFPSYAGGTLSFIDTVGIAPFVKRAEELAAAYGPRFQPSDWLKGCARRGVGIYQSRQQAAAS